MKEYLLNAIMYKYEEIITLYPESKRIYAVYKAQKGCVICRRKRLYKNLCKLVDECGARGNITSILEIKEDFKYSELLRIECENCVEKHLCQCYILLNEYLAGYKEHYTLAHAHLKEAEEEGCKANIELTVDSIHEVKKTILSYLGISEESALLIGNLACAEDRLKDLLNNKEAETIREIRLKIQGV